MLADIYEQFTEGFDTADLKDAKAPSGSSTTLAVMWRHWVLFARPTSSSLARAI